MKKKPFKGTTTLQNQQKDNLEEIRAEELVNYKFSFDFNKLTKLLNSFQSQQQENKKDIQNLTKSFIQFKQEFDLNAHIEVAEKQFSEINVQITC